MESKPFRVSLRETGEKDEETGKASSIKFTIPAAVVKALEIEKGDIVHINVSKILEGVNIREIEFPLFSEVIKGGSTSLAVTVDKKEVERYNLTKDLDLEITITIVKKFDSMD
ncbi:MAG: hypothetical protein BAJALOKI1v1_2480005 [Promethearchaeota archaeon]|nr:MAG: hypothetical protein BAJALOKI1v1_2480005 [Candidatus Lokiarchaeota archaeon]